MSPTNRGSRPNSARSKLTFPEIALRKCAIHIELSTAINPSRPCAFPPDRLPSRCRPDRRPPASGDTASLHGATPPPPSRAWWTALSPPSPLSTTRRRWRYSCASRPHVYIRIIRYTFMAPQSDAPASLPPPRDGPHRDVPRVVDASHQQQCQRHREHGPSLGPLHPQ